MVTIQMVTKMIRRWQAIYKEQDWESMELVIKELEGEVKSQ